MVKKNHAVSYKALNSQLSKMKKTLKKLKKKVRSQVKKETRSSIRSDQAMFQKTCRNGRMTHIYHAKMTIGKCDTDD